MAMSADGKIATATRKVASFGSPRDLEHLYELRASVDAILSGARTVNEEDVDLGPGALRFRRRRLQGKLAEHPLRIVVSGSGRLDLAARIFRNRRSPLIVLTTSRISASRLHRLRARADAVECFGKMRLDLAAAFRWLRSQWGVRRLLVEGGGETNGALFRAGLVNELHLTVCPLILGGRNAPTIADGESPQRLLEGIPCRLLKSRRRDSENFLVYHCLRRR